VFLGITFQANFPFYSPPGSLAVSLGRSDPPSLSIFFLDRDQQNSAVMFLLISFRMVLASLAPAGFLPMVPWMRWAFSVGVLVLGVSPESPMTPVFFYHMVFDAKPLLAQVLFPFISRKPAAAFSGPAFSRFSPRASALQQRERFPKVPL